MKEKLLKFSNPRNKNWWLFTGALVIFVLAVVLFTMTEEKDADSLQEYVKNGSVEFSVSDTFLSEDTELALTADAVYKMCIRDRPCTSEGRVSWSQSPALRWSWPPPGRSPTGC